MSKEKEFSSHVLDFLAGARGIVTQHISRKAAELEKSLSQDPDAPYKTGAPEGTKYDDLLSHLYRLTFGAHVLGDVLDCFEYRTGEGKSVQMARISTGKRVIEAICPQGVKLTSGMSVRLNQQNQIIGLAGSVSLGPVAIVREVLSEEMVSVEIAGTTRSVRSGYSENLSRGDRVVLDEMQLVVVGTLPKNSQQFVLKQSPKNSFDDIVGQDDVVRILKEVIDFDPTSDAVSRHYGRPRTKGALLYGPPGCGKTMFGEAIAHRMATRYGKSASESGYFYVKGPDFLDKYVGETERGIRDFFEEGDRYFEEHGHPATLAFDECEALLTRRGDTHGVNMEKTVIPTFLGLMNNSTAFVLLMTNRVDTLDPAVIRDGRIDRQIFIGRPTRASAERIIANNLARYPVDQNGSSKEILARVTADAFYDPKRRLLDEPLTLKDGQEYFTLGHIANGAMFTRLVQDAVLLAERRDRITGKLSGVSEDDLLAAVNALFEEKRYLDHREAIKEFFVSMKDRLPNEEQRQAMRL